MILDIRFLREPLRGVAFTRVWGEIGPDTLRIKGEDVYSWWILWCYSTQTLFSLLFSPVPSLSVREIGTPLRPPRTLIKSYTV